MAPSKVAPTTERKIFRSRVVFFGDWPVWQNANTSTEPAPGILLSTNSGTSWALNSGGVGPQYPLTLRVGGSPVNTPPTANAESYSTNEDTTLSVAAHGVLSNHVCAGGLADPLAAQAPELISVSNLSLRSAARGQRP